MERDFNIISDLEATTDVRRAGAYLDAITEHFLEFGLWQEKTAFDVAYELSYHNAWHQWEVEQERKSGEKTAVYREISLYHLHALSQRKVAAMEEDKEHASEAYQIACFVDSLIAEAVATEEELERRTRLSTGAA